MSRILSLTTGLLLVLAACDGGGTTPPDAAPAVSDATSPGPDAAAPQADAGVPPDTGLAPGHDAGPATDTGAPIPPDAGSGLDATVFSADGSVSGTVLEQVAINCPGALELCNRWQEGAPLADEQARHVRVSLPKLEREGLQPWQLAKASVDGVLVEKSHLDAQRWRPSPIGRSLRKYAVTKQGAYTQLQAEIAHDLGAAGTLVESYSLYRAAQANQPVKLDGNEWEGGFQLELPGVKDPITLESCRGASTLEPAVEVLRATRGTRHLLVTRFMNTQMAMAGSYPVHVTGVQVAFTDAAWAMVESGDFFVHTYVAQHHNWSESSVIDFTQEPRLYHTVFRPIAEGQTDVPTETPERLAFHGVNGYDGAPSVDVTMRRKDGTQVTEKWEVQGQLVRVDDTALTRAAKGNCADAEVFYLGFGGSTGYTDSFQLLTCPQAAAPGYVLKALVPTWFKEEPGLIGTKIEGKAIAPVTVSGRAGHTVQVGTHTVTLSTANGTQFFVAVKDSKGTLLNEYLTEKGELGPYQEARREELKASGPNGLSMLLTRQWAGQGVGESSIFAPLSFALTFGGRTVRVDSMDKLRYTNTHHNWADVLEARGEGLVLTWRNRFTEGVNHEVKVAKESGEVVVPWTTLQ